MTESIKSNKILVVTDDKGVNHLIIILKWIVLVVGCVFPLSKIPQSLRFYSMKPMSDMINTRKSQPYTTVYNNAINIILSYFFNT